MRPDGYLRADDRGVSVSVNHVLAIGITAILISGLLIAVGGLLDHQQRLAAENDLDAIGNALGAEVERVDDLAAGRGNATVAVTTDHPASVAGGTYHVALAAGDDCHTPLSRSDACLVLRSNGGASEVIPLHNRSRVDPAVVQGGAVRVVYDGGAITLEDGR